MKWLKSLIDGYLGRLLLVLLSTFLVFFFLEMIFRWISKVESAEDFLANSLTHTIDTLTYRNSGCLWREALYPHPYLDFVQNMKSHCFSLHVNEKGFYSPEFPKANDPNTFDILITGGSVANHLAVGMTQGGLIQRLEGLRAKDGRSIRAYSSAVASWKQPQQLIAYLLYQELFDAIVSIEGYNETVVIGAPNQRVFTPFFGTTAIHSYGDINIRWKVSLGDFLKKSRMMVPGLKKSYLYAYWLSQVLPMIERNIEQQILKSSMYKMLTRDETRTSDIDTYLRFIENLNILTSSSGQKYAVFFQPVPGISKPLTEQEKKYLAPKEFYDLYQEVVSKASHLNAPVYSLLDVFKGVTDEIYSDSIHSHIDEKTGTCLGYQLIIDRIIETLKSQWSLTSFENDKIGN